jgi:hypothetical protein
MIRLIGDLVLGLAVGGLLLPLSIKIATLRLGDDERGGGGGKGTLGRMVILMVD